MRPPGRLLPKGSTFAAAVCDEKAIELIFAFLSGPRVGLGVRLALAAGLRFYFTCGCWLNLMVPSTESSKGLLLTILLLLLCVLFLCACAFLVESRTGGRFNSVMSIFIFILANEWVVITGSNLFIVLLSSSKSQDS